MVHGAQVVATAHIQGLTFHSSNRGCIDLQTIGKDITAYQRTET